ncbi:DUF1513 domain-containing protein [Pseudomaricurvus alcaniphilus]|uniref:DUF1513 domain-containing protein n=1 Tax=Pseudomaricurvus alcaniphilus TaxID=1166482 RepID=UPI001408F69E|nr:DUF1513 domain-containing protein [Pseudomaricurvus alcaniphilus]NHN36045.1 DUF1513 domain-containing protein [Pseudomaricurvus alcaniphilus]
MTGIKRRQLLGAGLGGLGLLGLGAIGLAGAGWLAPRSHGQRAAADDLLLSACNDARGNHWIGGWRADGEPAFRIPVAHRAHAISWRPDRAQAVFYARRPGTELYIVDLDRGELQQQVSSPPGYHYYGHGAFSADGSRLFTTENAYQRGHGVIGIYDSAYYRRLGEFHCGGIGPHQLEFLSDQTTLAIATGGILTHPDQARENLNPDTMQPSLAYLDSRDGKVIDQFRPQHHQMSIRHLAVSADDRVVMGVQFQGDSSEILPLVLSHGGEDQLQPMQADELHWLGQKQYIASVAVDSARQVALTTSPKGNNISLWDLSNHSLLRSHNLADVAGATYCPGAEQFLVSNGHGQVIAIDARQPDTLHNHFVHRDLRWDNHLAAGPG